MFTLPPTLTRTTHLFPQPPLFRPMGSATAADALHAFGDALERIPPTLRKTMTYDQGKEMTYHDALTLRTGVAVYFADPHSPWQRGSNERSEEHTSELQSLMRPTYAVF